MRSQESVFQMPVSLKLISKILFILCLIISPQQYLSPDDMYNKIFCGYQGWFGTANDDPFHEVGWFHWCISGTEPSPNTVTFDIWPEYSEYDKNTLSYSTDYDWKYKNGEQAGFFSSNIEETIMLHCRWLRDYGIDGIFVQRFTTNLPSPDHLARMDNVLKFLIKGGEKYGIKVGVMYDITGTMITEISKLIISDWTHLVRDLKVTSSSAYQFHPDRSGKELPVVGIWGFGFIGEGVRGQAILVTDFLKYTRETDLHATILGGVPAYWRSLVRDSKPQYEEIYKKFDILSPWTVGRISNDDEVSNWTDVIKGDLKLTGKRGQEYMPVSFPGFSISNLVRNGNLSTLKKRRAGIIYKDLIDKKDNSKLNLIPRNGGNFMWSQFYHWVKSGSELFYIAMFDEVDEGTAIFKLSAKEELETSPELFLTLDVDGFDLRSDHYLWMAGILRFMISQRKELPEIQPYRLEKDSLQIRRKGDPQGNIIDGKININIVIKNFRRSYAEVFRKSDKEDHYISIKKFTLENTFFTNLNFLDETSLISDEYTYVIIISDENSLIKAVSDLVRTSYR